MRYERNRCLFAALMACGHRFFFSYGFCYAPISGIFALIACFIVPVLRRHVAADIGGENQPDE